MTKGSFSIELWEVGDCNSCLYSWLCSSCALAESRTALDGSNCCFNFWCLPLVPYRWIVRSIYDIGDTTNGYEDCYISCFCPCCTVNQLYQTTMTQGNPTSNGGAGFNVNEMASNVGCTCFTCLYTCFCLPCSVGDILKTAYGMPWWMGCCCTNLFFARNTVRYHYRLRTTTGTSEFMEECCYPCLFYFFVNLMATLVPFCAPIAYCQWIAIVTTAMNLQETVRIKNPGDGKTGYIVGYTPGIIPAEVVSAQPVGFVKA
mmetsp:Transcript_27695/g.38160  ORF Transcript_27695/g.38160 Transcript_27695/m.38160 type:complete len:259 (+) Transcript_27695:3-779(+)